jgi:hypothetical protein
VSERIKRTFGAVQIVALIATALAAMVAATVASMPRSSATSMKRPDPAPPVAVHYLDVLGLSPDALAAAGLNAEQAAQIKENLDGHFEEMGLGLQGAIDAWGVAYREEDLARRAVQSGKGTVENLTAKSATLATALSNKNSAINAAAAAALDQIDNAVVEKLARIKANRPMNVPVQYLVTDRTQEQWRQLRDALSHKKQRDALSRESDADATTVINDANAEAATIAAAAGIASNLAGITAAMQ